MPIDDFMTDEACQPAMENASALNDFESRFLADSATQPPSVESRTQADQHRNVANWMDYFVAVGAVVVCSFLGWGGNALGLKHTNIAMIFLAATAIVAARHGRGPSIVTAALGVFAFDFLFVGPPFAIDRNDTQYLLTLGTLLGIGILISTLTTRLQSQLRHSQEQERRTAELYHASLRQERRTAQLYHLTRQLSELAGTEFLPSYAGRQLTQIFDGSVTLFISDAEGNLELQFGDETPLGRDARTLDAAQWVVAQRRVAGLGSDRLTELAARFVPMIGSQRLFGVLGICPADIQHFDDVAECRMLDTCASLIALSMERNLSRAEADRAQVHVQSEKLRNALLSSVSHDLRTPLAMIAVTASGLLDESLPRDEAQRRDMLETVVGESNRLARQVDNLLEMARLNAGALMLNRQWHVLEELVGMALARLRTELAKHTVEVDIPEDFPLLWVAEDLMEQTFINLLENAARYTPAGSRIDITACLVDQQAQIHFADNGPGIPPGKETDIFEPFFRGRWLVADGQRGIGLGLAICHGLVLAQGGQITVANRASGGAEFIISLPCPQTTPQVSLDEIAVSGHF